MRTAANPERAALKRLYMSAPFVVECLPRGGHGPNLSIRGCDTDELERAADELEKATSELVKRAEELAKRSEELNRQLLRLAEALTRPIPMRTHETPPEIAKPADPAGASQPPHGAAILDEVKEFLDGPQNGPGLAWQDPRD